MDRFLAYMRIETSLYEKYIVSCYRVTSSVYVCII